jgi:hypothetical protein
LEAPPVAFGGTGGMAVSSNGQFIMATPASGNGVYLSTTPYGNMFAVLQSAASTANPILFDNTTRSWGYNTSKSFVIDHPLDETKHLVHACLEGCEEGVYYRGTGTIENDVSVEIALPNYADKMATDFTLQITPIFKERSEDEDDNTTIHYTTSMVENGKFTVYGRKGSFYWKAMGQRRAILTEVSREEYCVKGDGPYTYIEKKT